MIQHGFVPFGIERGHDDSDRDTVLGEVFGHVREWEEVALGHERDEKEVKLPSFGSHFFFSLFPFSPLWEEDEEELMVGLRAVVIRFE